MQTRLELLEAWIVRTSVKCHGNVYGLIPLKDGAYQFKGIFAPVYDYAGYVDLNKHYWNPKGKLGVTTHFSKIIDE